jgi:hypothetical protein
MCTELKGQDQLDPCPLGVYVTAIFPLESVPYWLVDAHARERRKSELASVPHNRPRIRVNYHLS